MAPPSPTAAASVMPEDWSTRPSSSSATHMVTAPAAAPPYDSGNGRPNKPSAAIRVTISSGNSSRSSRSAAPGATTSSAKSRTTCRNCRCSSERSKSMVLGVPQPPASAARNRRCRGSTPRARRGARPARGHRSPAPSRRDRADDGARRCPRRPAAPRRSAPARPTRRPSTSTHSVVRDSSTPPGPHGVSAASAPRQRSQNDRAGTYVTAHATHRDPSSPPSARSAAKKAPLPTPGV